MRRIKLNRIVLKADEIFAGVGFMLSLIGGASFTDDCSPISFLIVGIGVFMMGVSVLFECLRKKYLQKKCRRKKAY